MAMLIVSSTSSRRWRFESAHALAWARSNSHLRIARPSQTEVWHGIPLGLRLASKTELLDQCPVPLEVLALQVVQQPAAAADEHEQPAARVVVLRMRAQMLGQLVDALCEQRDLHLRRSGVSPVPAVRADDLLLGFLRERHWAPIRRLPQSGGPIGDA